MDEFQFEPIIVNSSAPGGGCIIRTFDDVGAFILNYVELPRRLDSHWQIVRQDLARKAHLRFVAAQPCLICQKTPCDAHHLMFAQPRALGRKVSDADVS